MNGPAVVGGYELLKLLGRGAFSSVYLARDATDGAEVALKVLNWADAADPPMAREWGERFDREVQAARRLDHPGIVALRASGRDGDVCWIAMERVRGAELSRYCRVPRLLPAVLVVELLHQLLEALAHAHERGVLHRDLKPANVLVDLPRRSLKLTDFGVARLVDAARTRTGVSLGSPSYMAPELLAGAEPDARADLYAVGVMTYEMLRGRLPYEGRTLGELLRAIASGHRPALQEPGGGAVDARLAAWVDRMLSREPASRLPDARSALANLPSAASVAAVERAV